jgi:formylglycine-generating enzyme required for sulfatase activity
MGKNPSHFTKDFEKAGDALQRPVEQVSWNDAQEFCRKLEQQTGKPYRLPTEAEWEYACRAIVPEDKGEVLTKEIWNKKYHQPFHFGETISPKIANYNGQHVYGRGDKGSYWQQTTPVGYFNIANAFGLYDVHGNVREWCEDDYHKNYKGAPEDATAWLDQDENTTKILRGGSWNIKPWFCRSANRFNYSRIDLNLNNGFRVAVSPQ